MLLTAAVLSCVKAVVARRPELRLVICIHGTMFYGEGAINDFFPDAVHLWFRTMLGVLRFHDFLTEPVPVTDYVAASVHTVCSIHSGEPPGDVLVFLPTRADIESAERLLAARALPGLVTRCLHDGLAVVDLIGDVLSPAPDGKRKVVLANDVANSAVFVEGIKYIVDSGYLCTDNALPSLTTTAGASSPPAAAQMVRALKVAVRSGYHIKRRGNEAKCFCLYTTAECRGMLRTCSTPTASPASFSSSSISGSSAAALRASTSCCRHAQKHWRGQWRCSRLLAPWGDRGGEAHGAPDFSDMLFLVRSSAERISSTANVTCINDHTIVNTRSRDSSKKNCSIYRNLMYSFKSCLFGSYKLFLFFL